MRSRKSYTILESSGEREAEARGSSASNSKVSAANKGVRSGKGGKVRIAKRGWYGWEKRLINTSQGTINSEQGEVDRSTLGRGPDFTFLGVVALHLVNCARSRPLLAMTSLHFYRPT